MSITGDIVPAFIIQMNHASTADQEREALAN